jgi:hypothetical protein
MCWYLVILHSWLILLIHALLKQTQPHLSALEFFLSWLFSDIVKYRGCAASDGRMINEC